MNAAFSRLDAYVEEHRDEHIDDLMDFLRIPSISSLPEHAADVHRAARWVAEKLEQIGMREVHVLETGGLPAVYAECIVDPNLPTVLVYGHVDVQPVDPEHLWNTPPFEPTIKQGRLYARGASDMKSKLWIAVKAVEALIAVEGAPPVNVKFLFEGEEEILSPSMASFLANERERLQADVVLCADGGFYRPQKPSITISSRGVCGLQINVRGPKSDVHSGQMGGVLHNPIHALARLLTSFHTPDGRVAVAGFYDGVVALSPEERQALMDLPFDDESYFRELGVETPFGEPGYSTLERLWTRPTLEVNGIWGGFQGEGSKTVIPAEAHAKITCRLVPGQEPDAILALLEEHIRNHTPPGVHIHIDRFPGSSRPYGVRTDHPVLEKAMGVLRDVYGEEPVLARMGGTLPLADMIQSILGIDFIFFAFGDPDNQVHAPNEFFRLESFDKGVRSYIRLLKALGEQPAL